MVVLYTSDNENFTVGKKFARRSRLINDILEDIGEMDTAIPLTNVNSTVLKKIIKWHEEARGSNIYDDDDDDDDDDDRFNPKRDYEDEEQLKPGPIDERDVEFLRDNTDPEMLFDILLAAKYLEIKPLLDAGSLVVAGMIKHKTPEEIRKLFNINNDFYPEEDSQIKKENEWAEDR